MVKPRIEGWVAITRERSQGELFRRRSVHVLRRAIAPWDEDLRLSRLRTSLTSLCELVVTTSASGIVIDDRLKVWRKVEARSAHQSRGGFKLKSVLSISVSLFLALTLVLGFPHAINGRPSVAESNLGQFSGMNSTQLVSAPTKPPVQSGADEACQQPEPNLGTFSDGKKSIFFGGLVVDISAVAEEVSGLKALDGEHCWKSLDK